MKIASKLWGIAAITATVSASGFSVVATSTEHVARAATVTTDACSADVTPSTGVSVRVATNGDCVVKFTDSSTVTWTRPTGIQNFEVLVVGGGGGGGAHVDAEPGGGGGGAVVHVPSLTLTGATYEVRVGRGGTGNNANPPRCSTHPWYAGENGQNSLFGSTVNSPLIKAVGGGGGGGACEEGFAGGSGGGAHCAGGPRPSLAAQAGNVDASITNARIYGNPGGSSHSCVTGSGGGGGASEPGEDGTATKSGDGGEGIALDVLGTGNPIVYGSGGGGAAALVTQANPSLTNGVGGTNGGNAKTGNGSTDASHRGVDETGSGGGAQLCPERPLVNPCPAGRGGDGVVIIRYSQSNTQQQAPAPSVENTEPAVEEPVEVIAETVPQVVEVPTRRVNQNKKTKPTTSTSTRKVVTTSTVPVVTTTVPTRMTTAPLAPETQPGEAKLTIDGEAAEMMLTRRDNQLFVSFGVLSSSLSAITPQGERRALDDNGNIRFQQGDSLEILATGFAGNTDIEVWVFSTPRDLGLIRTTTAGEAESLLTVPNNIESGNHRVVVSGTTKSGSKVVVAVGFIVGSSSDGVTTAQKFFIALPLTAAVIAGLIIPTRRRRRSEVA